MLGMPLQGQLELLQSSGFVSVQVHTDLQSVLHPMASQFESVEIDMGGARDSILVVNAKIRRLYREDECFIGKSK